MSPSPPQESEDRVYAKVMWRLLPFLALCYIVSNLERTNIGIGKLRFVADLGFSESVYGIGAGIVYLSMLAAEVPSNIYMWRIGARKTLLRMMIIWGPACAGLAWMSQPIHFYALRLILGVAEAGLFPGILLYMTFWIPTRLRARFIAFLMTGVPLSSLIGGPLGGLIMTSADGFLGLAGWRWLFIVEALPAFVLAGVTYFYLVDRPSEARWLTDGEKAKIARDLSEDDAHKQAHSHISLKPALRDPRLYALAALAVAINGGTGGTFFWLPAIIHRSGVESILMVGLVSAIPFVGGVIAQLLVARHSDRTGERRWHVAACALTAAAGWGLMPLVQDQSALTVATLALVAIGTFGAMGPFWSLPASLLRHSASAGGIAVVTTIGAIGSFASPIIVGWLNDRTGYLAAGQLYYCGLMLAGAALFLIFGPRDVAADPIAQVDTALTPAYETER